MKEVKQVITVKLPLKQPTKRKEKRLRKAIEESRHVAEVASNRMAGIPRRSWTVASPKNSWWWTWSKELGEEVDLPTETIHQTIQAVRETYCSWKSHGYPGKGPTFDNWNRVAYRGGGRQAKYYRQGIGKWFLSLPMESGRGQREVFPLVTGDYHRELLRDVEDGIIKAADGGELILKDNGSWWFHQPVAFTKEAPEADELDNVIAVKLARRKLVTAALFDLKEAGNNKYESPEWVRFLQSGDQIRHYRDQIHEKRRRLYRRGQLRKAKKLGDLESRYVDNVVHTVSRKVVDLALESPGRTGIVIEDLSFATRNFMQDERDDKRALSSWPFADTNSKITYKALKAGVPVFPVTPVRNSRWCSMCGHKAEKEGKTGWRMDFKCLRCGYEASPRYHNSVRNVARRFGEKHLDEEIHYAEEREEPLAA